MPASLHIHPLHESCKRCRELRTGLEGRAGLVLGPLQVLRPFCILERRVDSGWSQGFAAVEGGRGPFCFQRGWISWCRLYYRCYHAACTVEPLEQTFAWSLSGKARQNQVSHDLFPAQWAPHGRRTTLQCFDSNRGKVGCYSGLGSKQTRGPGCLEKM